MNLFCIFLGTKSFGTCDSLNHLL